MRRTNLVAAVAVLALVMLAACGSNDDGDDIEPAAQATADAGADTGEEPSEDDETDGHDHDDPAMSDLEVTPELADQVAAMRASTAKYTNDLDAALEDGFFIITQHIEDMGYHFLNPAVEEFDLAEPPILVYARDGEDWQLVAYEWVFPEEPDEPPMDGATYGDFPAACHYDDGLFVIEPDEAACNDSHPESGAAFTFWHPDLVTFHVWAWMHNPDGIYHGTNPLMTTYN
jgi:hypothetical protein